MKISSLIFMCGVKSYLFYMGHIFLNGTTELGIPPCMISKQ